MIINSREEYDSEGYKWEILGRRKAYAVAILAEAWAGAKLPPEFIAHAHQIKDKMIKDGTWASA